MCATTERRQRSTSLALSENNDGIDLVLDSNKADNGSDNNNNNNNNNNTKTAIGIEGGNKNNNNNNIDIDIDIDTSSTFCAEMIMLPSVCEGSSNFAEQMDTFMTCRHPLDLLGTMFHEDENDDDACVDNNNNNNNEGGGSDEHNNNDNNQVRTSGYHAIPRNCEYCGSNNIDLCHTNVTENNNYNNNNNNNTTKKCERPRSFFSRERPPFHPHDDTICSNGYSKWMTEKNIWLNTTINNNDADDTINKEREKEDEEHNNNSRSEDDETNITDKGTATTTANSTTTRRLAWI